MDVFLPSGEPLHLYAVEVYVIMQNTSRAFVESALGVPLRSLESCPDCIDPVSGAVFWGYVLGVVGETAPPQIIPQDPLAQQLLSNGYNYQLNFKPPDPALPYVLSLSASAPVDSVCMGRTLPGQAASVRNQSAGMSCPPPSCHLYHMTCLCQGLILQMMCLLEQIWLCRAVRKDLL